MSLDDILAENLQLPIILAIRCKSFASGFRIPRPLYRACFLWSWHGSRYSFPTRTTSRIDNLSSNLQVQPCGKATDRKSTSLYTIDLAFGTEMILKRWSKPIVVLGGLFRDGEIVKMQQGCTRTSRTATSSPITCILNL